MREFDSNGLKLAEYQGKLFEESIDRLDCSTSIFLRRFLHSNHLVILDKNDSSLLSLDPSEGLMEIQSQFGETSYGKIKASKEAMFWLGYIYRYISYTRDVSTSFLMKTFDYKKLLGLYYVYHTQDPEWCIDSLLQLYNLPSNYFDRNWRIKQAYAKLYVQVGQTSLGTTK